MGEEGELEREILHRVVCGVPAHYDGGLGVRAGHWSHSEAAPQETPKLTSLNLNAAAAEAINHAGG